MNRKLMTVFLPGVTAGLLSVMSIVAEAADLRILMDFPKTDPAYNKLITAFNAAYPSIKVTPLFVTNMADITVDTKRSPDIYLGHQDYISRSISKGLFVDLNKLVPVRTIGDYPRSFIESYSVGRKTYCLPVGSMVSTLVHNKKSFADAGLDAPKNDWTWEDDVYKACMKLTKDKNGDGNPEFWGMTSDSSLLKALVYCFGGRFLEKDRTTFAFTKKPGISAMNFLVKLLRDKAAANPDPKKPMGYLKEYPFFDGNYALTTNFQGTLNPTMINDWLRTEDVDVDAGLSLLPQGPAGSIPPVMTSYVLAMFSSAKNKPQAVRFIDFMSGADAQKTLRTITGTLPTTYTALRSKGITSELSSQFVKNYVGGVPDLLLPIGRITTSKLMDHVTSIAEGRESFSEALRKAEEEIKEEAKKL